MLVAMNKSPTGNNFVAVTCSCLSPAHTVLFFQENYEGYQPILAMEVQLNQWLPWYKRIWYAIKYVFRRKTNDGGHWDTVLLNHDSILKLRELCDNAIDSEIDYKLRTTNFQPPTILNYKPKTN
jgi:hypothetical protein